MGLGVLGRGVGDAKFLAECGARLTVTDLKSKAELASSLRKLKKFKNIKFTLGRHRFKDFENRDMIVKAAGVPLDSPYITHARKHKIPIEMSTALFTKLFGAYIIGVTGTRGKSTVAHLLYGILKNANKRVFLGGNVKNVSTLSLLKKMREGDYAVLELDSWQLQGFGESKISPNMAIFTNFMPDHLNYYKGNMRRYWRDKKNIFKYQKRGDFLITTPELYQYIDTVSNGEKIKSSVVIAKDFPKRWKLKIIGKHNRKNCALATTAARALGVPDAVIKKTLEQFLGVSGRLEFLREVSGVKIYNDTTSTTPDATIAALRALKPKTYNLKPRIVLIMGGADKGLDMSRLVEEIPKYCKAVILLPGTGTMKIKNAKRKMQNDNPKLKIVEIESLEEAVEKGMGVAEKRDILLFSPAFASFGLFKNEFDRGQQFNCLIKNL